MHGHQASAVAPLGFQTPITIPMSMQPISGYAAEMHIKMAECISSASSVIMARAATMPTIRPASSPRTRLNLQAIPITQEMPSAMPILQRMAIRRGQKLGCSIHCWSSSGEICRPARQGVAKVANQKAPKPKFTIAASNTAPQFNFMAFLRCRRNDTCCERVVQRVFRPHSQTAAREYLFGCEALLAKGAQAEGVVALGEANA